MLGNVVPNTQIDLITKWLRERVTASNSDGLVVGLSGGIDSAVVVRLCQLAMPKAAYGVLMPCQSDPRDESDARLLAKHFSLPILSIELEQTYEFLLNSLQKSVKHLATQSETTPAENSREQLSLANIKPRLRMTSLYFVANRLNYLVVGTGNRSELTIGYFTKYGDGGVDLLPIGRCSKREVYAIAVELGVPRTILDKPPSAGLWPGQVDETEMGFTYDELESYLEHRREKLTAPTVTRIEQLWRQSSHKRSMPPIADIGE